MLQEDEQAGVGFGSPVQPGIYGGEEATTFEAASKEASLVAAQASADSSSDTATPIAGSDKQVVEQLSAGQIAGIVLGVAAAAGVTAVGVMAYKRHKRHRSSEYGSGRYMRHDIEML